MRLSQAMVLEKMMEQTDDSIGPLSCVTCFVHEVFDLPRDSCTTYPKDSTFPTCKGNRWGRVGGGRRDSAPAVPCRRNSGQQRAGSRVTVERRETVE